MKNKGFTLIELLITMLILMIIGMGVFAWATTVIRISVNNQRNNFAFTMALDIANKLQRMSDNILIQPSTKKCIGYNNSGELRKCQDCTTGTLTNNLVIVNPAGLSEYTNPWNNTSKKLYLYDNNQCENKTWLDSTCSSNLIIQNNSNAMIDHPRIDQDYSSINPVRSYNNTTYYAVWSIAYISCKGEDNKRKIFVTVYWLDPEPKDTDVSSIETKINNGMYSIKSVSVTVEKSLGTES